MDSLVSFFITRPIPSLFAGSHFVVYALIAWVAFAICLARRRMTRKGLLVVAIFAIAVGIEAFQLALDSFFKRPNILGLTRYVGVFAPILWVWTGWAFVTMWRLKGPCAMRIAARLAVIAVIVWTFASQTVHGIDSQYHESARADVEVAAEKAARFIRYDYAGPERQDRERRTLKEYYTTRRPVVFSDLSAVAWLLRGQSEGAIPGRPGCCPYQDDYLFIRIGTGYGEIGEVDSGKYDYVTSIPGLGYEWRLFRRKTTPHR